MTYRELVYMCLDEIKAISDDATFTEDHVIFITNKYRNSILKQKYSDIKKPIPESNYQTICLDLELSPAISGDICTGGYYLKSKEKVPFMLNLGNPSVFPIDYYQGSITLISRERMKYVGYNKHLQNIIYASIDPNNYLVFKSSNPQHQYLKKVKLTGIFEDAQEAAKLQCDENNVPVCDVLDTRFPLEDALVPMVIEYTVKELLGAEYRPSDPENNAKDDLANLASYIRNNVKSNLAKQIDDQ